MDRPHQLAQFLRARRQRITPHDVGLHVAGARRVPGLRREEVAALAGLSSDYYMRLEQGRDHRPSERVLRALARALQLDEDTTAYLLALGHPDDRAPVHHLAREEVVQPQLQELLDAWTTTPAFVHGRRLDVLASNAMARALTPLSMPGTNLLRSWFLDLDDRKRYADVDHVLTLAVAYFRASVGNHLDEPDVIDLIDELSVASDEFRHMWARHDVHFALSGEGPIYYHPTVGAVHLRFQSFTVDGTDRQALFVVSAAPGSRDAEALASLASMVASSTVQERRPPATGSGNLSPFAGDGSSKDHA
jgi:transcriptional regulator with XRE-family HTH domain